VASSCWGYQYQTVNINKDLDVHDCFRLLFKECGPGLRGVSCIEMDYLV
jgi:hypothetical protein